eukprot:scaffold27202_cov108-Skeletonema_dohrnii-CCMP3373.AAC.2
MKSILFYILLAILASMPLFIESTNEAIAESTSKELGMLYSGEERDGSSKRVVTKGTASMYAASEGMCIASRNIDATKVMDDAMAVIFDPDATSTARKAAKKDLETVRAYLQSSGESLTTAVKSLAPMRGFGKYHESQEAKKRREANDTIAATATKSKRKRKKQPEVVLLENYNKSKKEEHSIKRKSEAPTTVSPDNKRVTRSSSSETSSDHTGSSFDHSKLPQPQNNGIYTKPEVVQVIVNALHDPEAPKPPTQRSVILAIIAAKYVPCQYKTVQRLMKKHWAKEPILDNEWVSPQGGQGRVVPEDVVAKTAESILAQGNEGSDLRDTVEKMIVDHVKEVQEEAGLVPDPKAVLPSRSTVDKYCVEMAHQGVNLVQKTTSKTETRSVAEKSERGSISNVGVVGYSQFEVMDGEDHDMIKDLEKASFRTRALYELMRRARGGAPIWVVRPDLLFSTDDTTAYIFDGKAGKEGKWVLASDRGVKNSGTSSIYRTEKVNMMNGIRVKITFTFSGAGMTAPLFITVSGLSEEEMPDDDFLHVKVPGLAINGQGVSVGNDQVGHVFFMRKGKGADEERVKCYQEEVLLPYIETVRKDLDSNYSPRPGMEVPTKLKAISWMDGDLAQVASVINSVEEFAEMGITVCKQNAARTGAEQPADLAPVFKLFKKYIAELTAKDNPSTARFRKKLSDAFKNEEGFNLKTNHKNALLDFLATVAVAATKACTVTNVMKGWIESGLVDDEVNRFPCLHRILATCKKTGGIKKSTIEQITSDFPSLLNEVDTHGRISEAWFDDHNYPRDCKSNGEEVLRPDAITREHMQRSKVMTHSHQVDLRLKNIDAKVSKMRSKLESANEDHEKLVESNRNVVDKLCKLAELPVAESSLVHCKLEHFADKTVLSPDLLDFILAHDDDVKLKKDVPSTKGKLEDALNGKKCRILHAFDCRMKPNRIEGKPPHDLQAFDQETSRRQQQQSAPRNIRTVTLWDRTKAVTASKLLSNVKWVNTLENVFDLSTLMRDDVSEEDKQNADVLVDLLRVRLTNHVNGRIEEESKRNDPIWNWASKNLPVCAAYMILAGHVKSNFRSTREEDSLLPADTNNFIPYTRFPNHHGVYLQHDTKLEQKIRSGKKTSFGSAVEGFSKRIAEHKKGCEAASPTSNFYKLYPSKSTKRSRSRTKQGLFEDLEHVIAASYDPKGEAGCSFGLERGRCHDSWCTR